MPCTEQTFLQKNAGMLLHLTCIIKSVIWVRSNEDAGIVLAKHSLCTKVTACQCRALEARGPLHLLQHLIRTQALRTACLILQIAIVRSCSCCGGFPSWHGVSELFLRPGVSALGREGLVIEYQVGRTPRITWSILSWKKQSRQDGPALCPAESEKCPVLSLHRFPGEIIVMAHGSCSEKFSMSNWNLPRSNMYSSPLIFSV